MCDFVVFDERGSYIINKQSGEVTWMREKNGVFVLDAAVCPYERINSVIQASSTSSFTRQGS